MSFEGVSHAGLGDLWNAATENLPWDGTFEALLPLHRFEVMDQWLTKDKIKSTGGTQISRRVVYRENGSFEWIQPAAVRTPAMIDTTVKITAPFVGGYSSYTITDVEIAECAGPAKLIEIAKLKRVPAKLDMAVNLEGRAWQSPDSATDEDHPRGVPYYITPILAADAAGGHNGGNPYYTDATQASDCSGVDSAVYTRWVNYNDRWTNVTATITQEDAKNVGKMFRRLHWSSPKNVTELTQAKYDKLRMYACEAVIDNWSEFVRGQNDQIGADGAKFYGAGISGTGEPTVKGFPLRWIEELDDDSTLPLYMINHDHFLPVFDRNCYFKDTGQYNDRWQPDVWTNYTDIRFNFLCDNRQLAGGVISYVEAA